MIHERGKHTPDLQTAQRLAAELGTPVFYLFEPNDDLAEPIRCAGRLSGKDLLTLIKSLGG